uniref:Uncharacterized protein n=1 Tax=Triticum urartu TaxID=4572 RepID=A0A8R7TR09_TRIUA
MPVETEFLLMSDQDLNTDIILDKENSVLASGKYNAGISPAKQGNLFPDKNVAPASRDLKRIVGKVLGSRMDSLVSAEYTSNRNNHQSQRSHTVDDGTSYSDKENLTPISTGDMKARRCLPKNLFQVDADQDQEAFCSDKENSTPVSSISQKTMDMSENRTRIESAITKRRVEDRLPS